MIQTVRELRDAKHPRCWQYHVDPNGLIGFLRHGQFHWYTWTLRRGLTLKGTTRSLGHGTATIRL